MDSGLLESLLGGDLAVNAHNINDPSIYTACGNIPSKGDSSAMMEDKEAASTTLKNFEFVPDALEVEAGKVARFTVTSEGAGHTFTIESLGVDVVMPAGTTETIEFDVPEGTPGEIQLKCRFHGSGGSGMVATIRVKGGGPGSADAGKDGSTTSEVPGLY